ncbi:MAG: DUF2721 domain-containing protein [Leptolyngbyaceae cyanobacterium bins.349]|nr:DUF2721 domain-containing protein [Leptolyngbyaceae cyanobacterium bins.349]
MSVEQTTQLIQLILNSVLMSIACALVLGGLTARHTFISQQLQGLHRPEPSLDADLRSPATGWSVPSRLSYRRSQIHRLRYRYRISRYSVLSAYYALLFAILSCFALVVRGMIDWNALIPIALGCFVIGVSTLLVAVGLTLVDWHLSDRALLDEVQQLLSLGTDPGAHRWQKQFSKTKAPSTALRQHRQKMRVG